MASLLFRDQFYVFFYSLTLHGWTLGQASVHQPLDYGHVGCLALLLPQEPDHQRRQTPLDPCVLSWPFCNSVKTYAGT